VVHKKDRKKKGIVCAKNMDKLEQKKVKEEFKFKNIQYIQE
jgi:hypothetical protein